MSKFINIGNTDFASVRMDEYVDKSQLIAYVNSVLGTQRKFLCVTRARRFGKSLAAKMLCAYYDHSCDSHSLFQDLKISQDSSFDVHLNHYPVIYLDASVFTTNLKSQNGQIVHEMNDALSQELIEMYTDVQINSSDSLPAQLLTVVEHTHKQFIFIIDEWDAICREMGDEDVMRQYVDWLRSMFKTSYTDRIFAGVYMTGILPIKQYNTESALNNFEEFSMVNPGPLAGYFGFTNEEVATLSKKYHMDADEIQTWYDGYQIGTMTEIYNPYSVMRAMQRQSIESYWVSTTTYEGLRNYIMMNFDGLRDAIGALLVGKEERVDVLRFTNDIHALNSRDAVLALLIHLGYLSYNRDNRTCRIPNQEVRQEFERTIQDTGWEVIATAISISEQLLKDTFAGNEEAVAKAIETVHQDNTSILQYNDENALAYVVSLAYQAAHQYYKFYRELPTGKGFADIVLVPYRNVDKPAIVLELKYNKSAEGAIKQIKEKCYIDVLKGYAGEVVLVGVNYDKRTKLHTCAIEKLADKATINTTEKGVRTTGKDAITTENRGDTTGKAPNTTDKVLEVIRTNPRITNRELAEMFGMTEDGVFFHTKKLRVLGRICRAKGRKKGYWEIIPTTDERDTNE